MRFEFEKWLVAENAARRVDLPYADGGTLRRADAFAGWDEATRRAEGQMREPLPKSICKRAHPGACRQPEFIEAVAGLSAEPIASYYCSACRDVERGREDERTEIEKIILGGSFLGEDTPAHKFAKEVVAAIHRLRGGK